MYGRGGRRDGGWFDGRPGGLEGRLVDVVGIDGGTADGCRVGTGGGGVTEREGRAMASGLDTGGGGMAGVFPAATAGAAGVLGAAAFEARFAGAFDAAVEVRLPAAAGLEAELRVAVGGVGVRRAEEGIFSF